MRCFGRSAHELTAKISLDTEKPTVGVQVKPDPAALEKHKLALAQVDAKVVALSKKHSGKHSVDFTRALPRNMQRDFKFDENVAN